MSYTFRIVFKGLCAFVADPPLSSQNNPPKQATVLLRDLTEGLPLADGSQVPPHFPMITFNKANYRSKSTRKPDSKAGLCFLNKEDVKILPGGKATATPSLTVFNPVPTDPKVPTGNAQRSLYYLVDVGKALGHQVAVLPGLLADPPDPPLLAGRIQLDNGTLSTQLLQPGSWVLLPPGAGAGGAGAGTDQFIAETLALEIGPLDVDVTLRFTPFGGGSPLDLVACTSESESGFDAA